MKKQKNETQQPADELVGADRSAAIAIGEVLPVRRDLTAGRRKDLAEQLVATCRRITTTRSDKKRALDTFAQVLKIQISERERVAECLERGFEYIDGKQTSLLDR